MIKVFMLLAFLIFILTFLKIIILITIYLKISTKIKILDNPTNYNMHDRMVPTGSGITFIFTYIILLVGLYFFENFNILNLNYPNRFYIFNVVLVLSTMSFYDDLKNLHPIFSFLPAFISKFVHSFNQYRNTK